MGDRHCISPSPSSRSCAESAGFSSVELLVALFAMSLLSAAALSVTLSTTKMFRTDRQRMSINQNLRSGVDLLGIELRQAGERLPGDFPVIEIVDGDAGGPDVLVVRRNLLDEVLPLCKKLNEGETTDEVRIAKNVDDPPQGCAPVADADADGWPDNLAAWRAARLANGGTLLAYVYNPVKEWGEFFIHDSDGKNTQFIGKPNSDPWQHTYKVSQQCRIYLLEERRYQLSGDTLQFVSQGNSGAPVNLIQHVEDFQLRAVMADGTILDAFDSDGAWGQLRAIELTITGQQQVQEQWVTRTLQTRFFPRNVLSL